jgi:EAL domain-containing protein (putative c-di-GMP-specific phosphodiesterase class I)
MNSTPLPDAKAVAELRHAIYAGGRVLQYQPQLDLRSGELVGVEAWCVGSIPDAGCWNRPSSSRWPSAPV